ncbi:shikimate dehydrogenase [Endozoicomonas sp. Mp262]|uniref:shikimate dehydrogenase n=1 Tax=Endozoicomonas sp. Mp262 TaxID=2919499 RepID=UPI0021D80C2A
MAAPADRYAVMGNPVAHSKSPRIHALFAENTQQKLRYDAIEVAIGLFEERVAAFFNDGNHGLSITVPFKEAAWYLADKKTARAKTAGAVNTLWRDENNCLNGDNTDGIGLVRDLTENHDIPVKNTRILVLGAGGAVRGVLAPLINEQPALITVANRTFSKAEELVEIFSQEKKSSNQVRLNACSFDMIQGDFDLIINGTAASLQGQTLPVSPDIINPETVCYDMMYGSGETVFNKWARESGALKCIDGLGMLVEQAAEQFFIWRGVRPETASVLAALRGC